jgi:hypothetical protein
MEDSEFSRRGVSGTLSSLALTTSDMAARSKDENCLHWLYGTPNCCKFCKYCIFHVPKICISLLEFLAIFSTL